MPTVFGTALNYACMRIMGVEAEDNRMVRARVWLQERGG
jgi:lanosterol synthase